MQRILWLIYPIIATAITNLRFGVTNSTHMELARSTVTRMEFVTANITNKDDYMLLMFDEIVMARDEENGIRAHIDNLMTKQVQDNPLRVLEIGYGLGISANMIQEAGCASHTIIEANMNVMHSLIDWSVHTKNSSDCIVIPVFGFWEDTLGRLRSGSYDRIFYDPLPSIPTRSFLAHSRRLLAPGGRLGFTSATYYHDKVSGVWNHIQNTMLKSGWKAQELNSPVLVKGSVMADCGHLYTKPEPTPDYPYRDIIYIIPNVTKEIQVQ